MTYLVQVWAKTKGQWETAHECATEAGVKTAVRIVRDTIGPDVRVLAKPDEMDVVWALQDLQRQGLVEVRLVGGQWRHTLREGKP